jgi:hypothetical protein
MSSSGFYQSILARGAQAYPHLASADSNSETQEVVVRDPAGQDLHWQKRQYYRQDANYVTLVYQSQTSTSNVLASGGIVDIICPAGSASVVDQAAIELNLSNGTGAACTVSPAQLLLSYLEIAGNSGNQLIQRLDGFGNMFLGTSILSPAQYTIEASATNQTLWAAPVAIANNGTATYTIPLHECFFEQNELFLGGLSGDIRFRLYFNASSIENGAMPSLVSATLRLSCRELPDYAVSLMKADYLSGLHDFRYLNPVVNSQTLTMAASQTYSIQLSGLVGMSSGLMFTVRQTPVTAAAIRTPVAIASFAILDASGRNVIGGSPLSAQQNRLMWNNDGFDTLMPTVLNVYEYQHQRAVQIGWLRGAVSGGFGYSGKEQLQITTPAGFSGGQYQIDVFSLNYGVLRVNKGSIELYQS